MSIVQILPAVSPAIVKSVYDAIAQEGCLPELAADFQQGITARGLDYIRLRRTARPLEPLAERFASRLLTMFASETTTLPPRSRLTVLLAVCESLSRDDVDDVLLSEIGNDSAALEQYLEERSRQALAGLDEAELMFYRRLVREVCRGIIRVAAEIHDFEGSPVAASAEGQELILTALADEPDLADAESTRILRSYLDELLRVLDRPGPPGIFATDATKAEQGLYRTFVPPDLVPTGADTARRAAMGSRSGGAEMTAERVLDGAWRLLVVGEAGSGKSALLRWIAMRAACREFPRELGRWNRTVPIYLRLRELAETGLPDVDALARALSPSLEAVLPDGWLHRQLERGRGVVLIDGIDELPRSRRGLFIERLRTLVDRYPLARFILASRPAAVSADLWPEWTEWAGRAELRTVEIAPLSEGAVDTMIDRWHMAEAAASEHPSVRREARSRAASLAELLRADPRLARLARNPLQCALLCTLAREGSEPRPATRPVLFDTSCTAFLDRPEENRGRFDPTALRLTETQKRLLLEGLASWLVKNGMTDATPIQADKRFADLVKVMNLPRAVSGTAVRMAFVDHEELLRENAQGRIEFVHRAFQEYLAARAIVREDGTALLLDHATDDMWWDTIIFAAGMLQPKERETLIAGMVDRARPPRRFFRRPEPAEYDRPLMQLALACVRAAGSVATELNDTISAVAGVLFPAARHEEEILA